MELATLVVLSTTLIVLIWYTVETYHLRRIAQRQLTQSRLPVVILDFPQKQQGEVGNAHLRPKLCNIGFGAGFNVKVSDISQGEWEAKFNRVSALASNSEKALSPFVYKSGERIGLNTPISYFRQLMKAGVGELIMGEDLSEKIPIVSIPVEIRYDDGLGENYFVEQNIEYNPATDEAMAYVRKAPSLPF